MKRTDPNSRIHLDFCLPVSVFTNSVAIGYKLDKFWKLFIFVSKTWRNGKFSILSIKIQKLKLIGLSMSLFKVREFFNTQCGCNEEFDQFSIHVTNIDNASDNSGLF